MRRIGMQTSQGGAVYLCVDVQSGSQKASQRREGSRSKWRGQGPRGGPALSDECREGSRGGQHLCQIAHQYAADAALLVEVADAVAAGARAVLEGAGRGTGE